MSFIKIRWQGAFQRIDTGKTPSVGWFGLENIDLQDIARQSPVDLDRRTKKEQQASDRKT